MLFRQLSSKVIFEECQRSQVMKGKSCLHCASSVAETRPLLASRGGGGGHPPSSQERASRAAKHLGIPSY